MAQPGSWFWFKNKTKQNNKRSWDRCGSWVGGSGLPGGALGESLSGMCGGSRRFLVFV